MYTLPQIYHAAFGLTNQPDLHHSLIITGGAAPRITASPDLYHDRLQVFGIWVSEVACALQAPLGPPEGIAPGQDFAVTDAIPWVPVEPVPESR